MQGEIQYDRTAGPERPARKEEPEHRSRPAPEPKRERTPRSKRQRAIIQHKEPIGPKRQTRSQRAVGFVQSGISGLRQVASLLPPPDVTGIGFSPMGFSGMGSSGIAPPPAWMTGMGQEPEPLPRKRRRARRLPRSRSETWVDMMGLPPGVRQWM